jgi:hypothetical protein
MNFGFNMKWNPSGKDLQGKINIIFRRYVGGTWKTYQIKSNKVNSLAVDATSDPAYRKAIMSTKANLTDVTDPLNPIALGGNLTLAMDAWEHKTQQNGSLDKVAVTLTGSGNQGLLFSSHWTGGSTVAQIINGGKIKVRNSDQGPAYSGEPYAGAVIAQEPITHTFFNGSEEEVAAGVVLLPNQPNPFSNETSISVELGEDQNVSLKVFDNMGRLVIVLHEGALIRGMHEFTFRSDGLADGFYYYALSTGTVIETKRMLLLR